ncbi:hypothetical protein EES41_39775 (plasmid) [Streptomyces sp. ADI95-16]|uniref:hypothetical protein n=1 Tax=Streptomyces sp. ADI95-16 TaxID=1522758 RepID=UPI000F42D4E1|nr:hypothetical protein [Streptomyces sp. ADI95-16]AYV32914.1 hypothetical protein EES41_39775 [Streptomyces sp. ADI95-16]
MFAPILEERSANAFIESAVKLLVIDETWTDKLQRSDLNAEDITELAKYGLKIEELWVQVAHPEVLKELLNLVKTSAPYGAWNCSRVLDSDDLNTESLGRLTPLANVENFDTFAASCFGMLSSRYERQLDVMAHKVHTLANGDWSPGDIEYPARCALIGAVIVVAAVLGNLMLVCGGLFALAAQGCVDEYDDWMQPGG